MLWKRIGFVAISLGMFCFVSAARQTQEGASHVTLQGVVRTAADNVPVPGASVHIVEENSGKSWITWTDDTGKFRLPELPAGKFHIEVTQIGFGTATQDVSPTTETSPDIVISMHVATAAEIAADNAKTAAANAPATATTEQPKTAATTQTATTTTPAGTTPTTPAKPGTSTQTARNGRGNQQGQNGQGGRGGGRGFTQVNAAGQGGAEADTGDATGGGMGQDTLGAAASADALLVAGQTAQGVAGGFPGGFPGGGFDINNPGGGPGGFGAGENGGIPGGGGGAPGMTGAGGGGAGGGGGFGPGGGGGGGGFGGGGGGGRGGGGGGGGRGGGPGGRGGRGGQGPQSLYGVSRLARQRANQIHYTLNETLTDSAFNANSWSATGNVVPKVAWNRNVFGGTVGGPVRIPKIYDGRDRTYFNLNVQIGTGTSGVNNYGNVPTAEERVGDFCNSGPNGTALLLYNYTSNFNGPRSLLPVPGNCNLQGQTNPNTGQLYIPAGGPAAALVALIPQPNLTNNSNYNYLLQGTTPTNSQAINMRVNQTITPKLNFGVVYNISQAQSSGLGLFPSETSTTSSRGQNVSLTLNENISTRLINAILVNFTRQRTVADNAFAEVTNEESLLGITQGVNTTNPLDWGLPGIGFSASSGTPYSGFSDTNPSLRKNETWNLTDTLSYILPKHTLHFGFTFRRVQLNSLADPDPRGQFTFNGLMTENFAPNPNDPTEEQPVIGTGSPFADFLMGLPASTAVRYSGTSDYLRTHGFIAYANDDWHVLPRLTITYGLRYELMYPASELYGRLSNLDVNPSNFTQVSLVTPCSSLSQAVSPCGQGPYSGALPTTLIRPNYDNFAPAFGIAWRVPGKFFEKNNGRHALVVRTGYRIFDISSAYNTLDNYMLNQAPFAVSSTFTSSAAQVLTLQNGFPSSSTLINTIAVNPNYRNSYAQTWNFGLESQITDGLVWQLTYVGTKGTHLDQLTAPNVLSTTSPALTGQAIPQQLAYTYDISGGNSIFNALQARLQRRMRNGFTYTILYQFAKSIDDSSSIGGSGQTLVQEYPLFALERGLSSFDIRHTLTANATYELPFGPRKEWAHKGTEARLLSNFRLSGSVSVRSGTPLTPYVVNSLSEYATGNFQTRPDILPGCNVSLPQSLRSINVPTSGGAAGYGFFNTNCFAAPGSDFTGTTSVAPGNLFGDLGRDTIEGPGSAVVNLALQRTITLDRDNQMHLDMRWEVNNVTNHPNWSGVALGLGTRNFGDVTGAGGMRTMDAVIRLNF